MNVEQMLCDEIRNEFENLKSMELGTEQYKATVDGLSKLMDKAIELEKTDVEHQDRLKAMKDEKLNRWIKYGIDIASFAIPCVITVWGTIVSLRFEQEGTVTTIVGRGFINKLLPKK